MASVGRAALWKGSQQCAVRLLSRSIHRYTTNTVPGEPRFNRVLQFDAVDPAYFPRHISKVKDGGEGPPTPCRFPSGFFSEKLPAFSKWFMPKYKRKKDKPGANPRNDDDDDDDADADADADEASSVPLTSKEKQKQRRAMLHQTRLNIPYLKSFGHDPSVEAEATHADVPGYHFARFEQPLSEIAEVINEDVDDGEKTSCQIRVYCAQTPPPDFLLPDIPEPFQHLGLGVRTTTTGDDDTARGDSSSKGQPQVDIYSQAIWLGSVRASRTPLHKDPNDNIFIQLSGQKHIRVFSPSHGTTLLEACGAGHIAKEGLRMEDMMVGTTRQAIDSTVWLGEMPGIEAIDCYEAIVGPGDGVFIPRGWWHAVIGFLDNNEHSKSVVASANWWFRVATNPPKTRN